MKTFYELSAKSLKDQPVDFHSFEGKVVLVVNTASKCGFTPQYAGLEELYRKYKDQGLVVLGFPCNQFGNQEPGNPDAIKQGCLLNYGVSFPMFEKIKVNGEDAHPVYQWLKSQQKGLGSKKIKWNFTKFLIDGNGKLVKRFGSMVKPEAIDKHVQKLI